MMILQTAGGVLIFAVTTFGLGAACAPAGNGHPVLRLAAGTALGLGGLFVTGFLCFVAGCSNPAAAGVAGAIAAAVLVLRWRAMSTLLLTDAVRRFLVHWLVFAAWSLGLLALVKSYSGGGWAVDWIEHWQRTVFFLDRQPLDTRFAAIYSLTARPPLVNLLIALWLEATGPSFALFQMFMTLFGSLVLLPCWILAERWRGTKTLANGWLVLVLMASPLVAQNLTFAWTKLPTAFFVLVAIGLCLESLDDGNGKAMKTAAVCLGLAVLAHYSACPWVIALALGFLFVRRPQWRTPKFLRECAVLLALFAMVPALWVGWAAARYGSRDTMASNTTADAWKNQSTLGHFTTPVLNIYDTLVPFLVRGEPSDGLIIQESKLGRLRDVAFSVYQINLPFAFGFGGIWVLASLLDKRSKAGRPAKSPKDARAVEQAKTGVGDPGYVQSETERLFWWIVVPSSILLGIIVHTPRDEWGLAHICLQPLVLIGLARIAAGLGTARVSTRAIWAILALVDFAAGIVLHFGLESGWLARFVAPGQTMDVFFRKLSIVAVANARNKATFHLEFFADRLNLPVLALALFLTGCLVFTIRQSRQPAAS